MASKERKNSRAKPNESKGSNSSWGLTSKIQQRLAGENAFLRPSKGGDLRIALGYPNSYHVGMSNLGLQLVYGILNLTPGVVCERFFLPDREDLEQVREGRQGLVSYESQCRINEFDVVAFTCAYENDYTNFLVMLELAGIPLCSADRGESDPLVLIGGAITLLNPEPLADFADIFAIGEAEGLTEDLIDNLRATKHLKRRDRLEALAQVDALYIPSLYEEEYEGSIIRSRTQRGSAPAIIAKNYLSREQFVELDCASWIMSGETEFANTFLVEVSRGCPYVCRFCTVGFSYPKVRWKPLDRLTDLMDRNCPKDARIGLISATIGNYPEIDRLCERLMSEDRSVSFSSLRADMLPDSILETLVRGGSKSLTLAPESGSEDLRKSINKRFSDQQYFEASRRCFRKGVKNIKMYSMVGLPNEQFSDMDALVKLVLDTRKIQIDEGQAGGRITLSLGLFVPKPLTPYQWHPLANIEETEAKMQHVQQALSRVGGVVVNSEPPKTAIVEAILARADRRMGSVLRQVYRKTNWNQWTKALTQNGLNLEEMLYRERTAEEILPWSHLASSWPKERLLRDSQRAKDQRFGIRAEV